jgi:ABC-type polar amino acid transport system ATPase subunit
MTYQGFGRVIKGVGGLFTVRVFVTPEGALPLDGYTVFARGRGNLRRRGSLLVGDLVQISYDDSSFTRDAEGGIIPSPDGTAISIDRISTRSCALIRPPMANLDVLFVTVAAAEPEPVLETVAKLISSLYDPWDGEILMDGIPLRQIPPEIISASIATVSQEITIFTGSIRDNLTLWNNTIMEQDIIRAAKDACIHDTITKLPGAYDYKLTEEGQNLSGGQRQRMEIARALVLNPSILVMDEATSALDPIVEKEVMDNIKRRGCTCVIVAHRLSTIRDCDEILVMSKGQIVQRGTHDELKDQEGLYRLLISNE